MRAFVEFLATAGLGRHIPKGPGTYGTVVAIPIVALMWWTGPIIYMAFAVALMIFAIIIAQFYEDFNGRHDAKEVVIDEVAGFVIAMTWLPLTWQAFLIGFVIFRAIDIFKPFPVGMIDRKVRGGLGVVADDVVAGILTNILLQVLYNQTEILGVRL